VQLPPIVIPDDLLHAAQAGDPAALTVLWDLCAPLVASTLRYAARPVPGVDRRDLAQEAAEVFLRLLRAAAPPSGTTAAGDGASPAAPPAAGADQPPLGTPATVRPAESFADTLNRAVRQRIRSYLRAERRRSGRQVAADLTTLDRLLARRRGDSPGEGPTGLALARALARLSPRQRAVIAGLYERDRPVAMLAAELGVTPQAVTAVHRRALATLRTALDVSSPGDGDETATDSSRFGRASEAPPPSPFPREATGKQETPPPRKGGTWPVRRRP
jgi:hypothetical protein